MHNSFIAKYFEKILSYRRMKTTKPINYILLFMFLVNSTVANISAGHQWVTSDIDSIMEASSRNDYFAQGFLALVYIHGDKNRQIDYDKAYKLAVLSSEGGHWLGHFALGYLYRNEPIGPDLQKVRELYLKCFQDRDGTLIKLSARKDPVACYVLGEIFTSDELRPLVLPDLKLAFRHYEISSEAGYAPSAVQLALFKIHSLISGNQDNVEDEQQNGIDTLKLAVQKNLPSAHHYLGRAYFEGNTGSKDLEMALVHFRAAADKGYGESQLILADYYAQGLVGPPKYDIAKRYASLALKTHYEKAKQKLDYLDQLQSKPSGVSNVDLNNELLPEIPTNEPILPVPLVEEMESLKTNDNFSSTLLPSSYSKIESNQPEKNEGNKNETEAENVSQIIPTLSAVSEQSSSSICEDAKKYYWGRGVEKDYTRAYNLFLQAAQTGHPESSRYLGLMFLSGKGVIKNVKSSIEWFEKAAAGGDDMGRRSLERLRMLRAE